MNNRNILRSLRNEFASSKNFLIKLCKTLFARSTVKKPGERRVPITRYLVNCQVFTTKPAFILEARQFYVQRRESQEMAFNGCF